MPSSVLKTDYLNTATSTYTYDFYDGLGRLIQENKSTENSGTSTVATFTYNSLENSPRKVCRISQRMPQPQQAPLTIKVLVVGGGGGGGANDGGGGGGGWRDV